MAAVAICPLCHHEVDVPEGADTDTGLRCLSCHASFPVRDAELREVEQPATNDDGPTQWPEIALDDDLPSGVTLELGSESLFAKEPEATDEAEAGPPAHEPAATSAKDVPASPTGLTESGEVAAQRIERWFRSADTVEDIPPISQKPAEAESNSLSGPEFPPLAEGGVRSEEPGAPTEPTDAEASPELEVSPQSSDEVDAYDDRHDTASDPQANLPEWSAPFSEDLPAADTAADDRLAGDSTDKLASHPGSHSIGETVETTGDSVEEPQNADFEIKEVEVDRDRPTWDDTERMDQLLADVDAGAAGDEPLLSNNSSQNRDADSEVETVPPIVAAPHRPRRRKSPAALFVGIVVGGLLGLTVGYYGLLWISWLLGRDGDVLQIAKYFPASTLPPSSQTAPAPPASEPLASQQTPDNAQQQFEGIPATPPDNSGEVTAAYEAPLTSDAPGTPERDRYATSAGSIPTADSEPLELDGVAAAPMDQSALAVVDAPNYTAEQLSAALAAAREAQAGLVSGDLSDPAVQRTKGSSYTKFSYLTELVTFADATSEPQQVESLREQAEALFRDTLSRPQIRNEVAYISTKWMDSPHRSIGGVFTVGTMVGQSPAGSIVEMQIDLGTGSPLIILAPGRMANQFAAAGPIAIAGSIIENPAERIHGYLGNVPRAIWAGMLIPLD